jgi:hypothetical protein
VPARLRAALVRSDESSSPERSARDSRAIPIDRWRPRSIVHQVWRGPFRTATPCRSNPYGSKTTRSVRRASRPDGARASALYRAVDETHGGVGPRCLDRLVRHAEARTRSRASRRMDGHAGRRRLGRSFFRNRWLRSSGRLGAPARLISPGRQEKTAPRSCRGGPLPLLQEDQEIGHRLHVRPLVELPDDVGADLAAGTSGPEGDPDAPLGPSASARRAASSKNTGARAYQRPGPRRAARPASRPSRGCARVQECSSRVDAGLFQAEAIDPSVTSPLCAAKAARTSSFSRGGTPK